MKLYTQKNYEDKQFEIANSAFNNKEYKLNKFLR